MLTVWTGAKFPILEKINVYAEMSTPIDAREGANVTFTAALFCKKSSFMPFINFERPD